MQSQMFQIDINATRAAAVSFTITQADAKAYTGFAFDGDVLVSFNNLGQAFPLAAGTPMGLPANVTSIETNVPVKLYLGY